MNKPGDFKKTQYLNIEGRILKFSHLEKTFYPGPDFKKKNILSYYRKVSSTALPHLANRPFTLLRFPDGVHCPSFFEKKCPTHRPLWIQTGQFGSVNHCLINDLPSLLWVVNLAAIELHTTLAQMKNLQSPTFLVFDLDPGEGVSFQQCIEIALLIRSRLKKLKLESFPKTSGKKGIHIAVPLNLPSTFQEGKAFVQRLALGLEQSYPDLVTTHSSKKHRSQRVFIDWSQNTDFKTTTTVYSMRANEFPTISTPLSWEELKLGLKKETLAKQFLEIGPEETLRRIAQDGDLFAPVLLLKQKLPKVGAYAESSRSRLER